MWALAIPAAMAAMGYLDKKQQREQAARDRKAEAEIARWSPWTGMAPQRVGAGDSELGGAVTGGLQGASFMQAMNSAGYGKDSPKVAGGASAEGGTALAQQNPSQMSMQQPNQSFEDPYVLQQRRYGEYGAQQQPTWELLAQNYRSNHGS